MPFQTVDVQTAHTRQGEGWSYVDVRTPEEFAQGHPEGAVNIPILLQGGIPNARFVEVMRRRFPTDTKLLVGCRSGARSARACEVLGQEGYLQLANVAGGMLDWDARRLPRSTAGQTWTQVS